MNSEDPPEVERFRSALRAWLGILFTRAHTIYAESSLVQRTIIGERVLG